MSRDPRSKFRKKLFFPNSAFNIRKSYKFSSREALCFRSYQPETSLGVENTPSAFRVKAKLPINEIRIEKFLLVRFLLLLLSWPIAKKLCILGHIAISQPILKIMS